MARKPMTKELSNPNNSYKIYNILHFPLALKRDKGGFLKKVDFNRRLNFEPFVIPAIYKGAFMHNTDHI